MGGGKRESKENATREASQRTKFLRMRALLVVTVTLSLRGFRWTTFQLCLCGVIIGLLGIGVRWGRGEGHHRPRGPSEDRHTSSRARTPGSCCSWVRRTFFLMSRRHQPRGRGPMLVKKWKKHENIMTLGGGAPYRPHPVWVAGGAPLLGRTGGWGTPPFRTNQVVGGHTCMYSHLPWST